MIGLYAELPAKTFGGKNDRCPILKIDTNVLPMPGKLAGQVEIKSITILTVLHGGLIEAIDAAQCVIRTEEMLDASRFRSFC
jgi:hypothetical protein